MALFGRAKTGERSRSETELAAAIVARIAGVTDVYREEEPMHAPDADLVAAPSMPAQPAIPFPPSSLPVAAPELDPPVWMFDEGEDDWPIPPLSLPPMPAVQPGAVAYTGQAVPAADPAPHIPAPVVARGLIPETVTAAVIGSDLMERTSKHLRSIGTVNILVAGQTGVGKSTLVNSVFGDEFARTAAGRPVTQTAEWHTSDTMPLRILDTRGLEAKDYQATLDAMKVEIEASRSEQDERNQLHIGWVCIAAPSSRVQDCEIDIVRLLNKYHIPVIVVLTKDDDDMEFASLVASILEQQSARFDAIVRVRSVSKPGRPPFGLNELVTATFTVLPEAHRAAFAAAQKINRDLNRSTAEDYVTFAASAAAAAAVVPLPFVDMAALLPTQAAMLIGISRAFGLTLERAQVMQLITTALGCMAMVMAGGWALGSVLKFIPGPGSVMGAVVNASVAGAMTRTLGRAYIRFLYQFIDKNGRLPSADEIFGIFPAFYKTSRKGARA